MAWRWRWALAVWCVALPLEATGAMPEAPLGSERLVWPSAITALEARLASEDVEVRRKAASDLGRLPAAVQRRLLPRLFSDPDPDVRLAVADAALAIRLSDAGARVSKWLSDPDPRVRESAAEVLSVLRDPGSVAGLGRALEDAEASVRSAAATALGNSRSPEASSFLLGHLDDADPEVRHAVIAALEDLGDTRAVVPLIGRIQEQRAALRRQAAKALGTLADARAVGALVVALADADAGVRMAAASALGKLKAREAVWSLGTLLEDESDPEVQAAALDALGEIGTPTAVDTLLRALALPRPARDHIERALVRAGDAASSTLERCVFQPAQAAGADVCVAALGRIGGAAASTLIERALRQGSVTVTTGLAALGAAGQATALPTVLEYLTSGVPAERRAAIEAAGHLLDPEHEIGLAVEPIAHALERAQESRLERAALVGLLGRTGSPRAAPSLLAAARSNDEYLRAVALQALGEIGPAAADEVLLAGLDTGPFPTRYTAAVALRRVGGRASLEPLLERLAAAPLAERATLAVALAGPLRDEPSDEQLDRVHQLALAAPGPELDAVIEAIAHVPGARGTAALERLLPLLGKIGRAKIAEALGAHADGATLLAGLLEDPDPGVRANAAWSLGAVGTARELSKLAALRADTDVSVAANAIAAIALVAARTKSTEAGADLAARGEAHDAGGSGSTGKLARAENAAESLAPSLPGAAQAGARGAFAKEAGESDGTGSATAATGSTSKEDVSKDEPSNDPAFKVPPAQATPGAGDAIATPASRGKGGAAKGAAPGAGAAQEPAIGGVAPRSETMRKDAPDARLELCRALEDPRGMVLVNALSGLRRLGIACADPAIASALLEHHPSDEVRLAAARLIRDRWAASAPGVLARCAAKDVSGLVAVECTAAAETTAPPPLDVSDVGVLVVPTGETAPTARAPFALVRADGFVRSGTSDRRGALWEPSAPRGPLRLTLPAVYSD